MSYTYEYAVIIGIDGMGNFNKNTNTPNLDRIFENGAQSFYGLSMYPTISAQNWGSMLTGADPEIHDLTNGTVCQRKYERKDIPTLFARMRETFPDALLVSCSNWDPINFGIIEEDIGVEKYTGDDETVCQQIETAVARKPKLLFIQFDGCDEAGHGFGYGTEGHLEQIRKTDALVGRVYEAYKKAGIADDTLFTALADHGGYKKGHGSYSDGEKYVYFAAAGKTVNKCEIDYVQVKDINAVILHAFGLDIPEYDKMKYSSQIPLNIFSDYQGEYNKTTAEPFYIQSEPTPPIDSENGLLSFFDKDEIKLAMFFDNDAKDELGKVNFTKHGQIKYYTEGRYGSRGELGAIGWLSSDDIKFGKDSFSIAVWIKIEPSVRGNCYICGTKAMRAESRGFMFSETDSGTLLSLESDDHSTYEEYITPFINEVSEGWVHALVCIDRENMILTSYNNFQPKRSAIIDKRYDVSFDNMPFTVGNECSFRGNNEFNVNVYNIDDLIIFNKALTPEEVAKLAAYYKV